MPAFCRKCNSQIADDKVREPCPNCGGLERYYSMKAEAGSFVMLGSDVKLGVKRMWSSLLATADRLLAAGEYGVAVVVAQTACEVATEKAMFKASPTHKPLFTYALRKKENLADYKAVTGDSTIDSQNFWAGYLQLIEDRNKAVHEGHEYDRGTVQADIDAAKAFVAHVVQHNGL